jgi:hypothetical protein
MSFFSKVFTPLLEPYVAFYSIDTGGFTVGVKWPDREAIHSPSFIAEVKNAWS